MRRDYAATGVNLDLCTATRLTFGLLVVLFPVFLLLLMTPVMMLFWGEIY